MPVYYTPGVYFEKIDSGKRELKALRTDIPGFVGFAQRGPVNEAVRLESWNQFESLFGGFIPQSYLAYAIRGFFENGGDTCYLVRVVDLDVARKAEAKLLNRKANEAFRISAANEGRWGNKVRVTPKKVSLGSTITIFKYQCDSCDYCYDEEEESVSFANLPHDWKCPGCGAAKETFKQISLQPGDGSFSLVRNITGFEAGSVVKAFQNQNGSVVEEFLRVGSVDLVNKKIIWKPRLGAGFDLSWYIHFSTVEFTLIFSLGDKIKEVFENLSLNPDLESRYLVNIINERSHLVTVERLNSAEEIKLPDPAGAGGDSIYLEGGADGISTIKRQHLVGDSSSAKKEGLRCFEDVDEVSMICIPDIMIQRTELPPVYEKPPEEEKVDPCLLKRAAKPEEVPSVYQPPSATEPPPEFSRADLFAVQQSMTEHCEIMKDRIAILDPPWGADLSEIQNWRQRFDSKYAAMYYPWIRVDDPLRLNNQITRLIPPSGHIAGVYSRTDREQGVHKAPANQEVREAKDVDSRIESPEQDILNPMGINCLRIFPKRGVTVWGARTISSDPSWRFVNVRRLLIMLEESVKAAMHWAVFEPNDLHLRMGLRISVSSFLEEMWRKGALAGATPEQAFFVKCDEENNPQRIIDAGRIITDIGVAPSIPGEFIVFRIGKVEDRMEATEES